ncbi:MULTISPECIES: carboxylating nicotinate-nucleotide diphosphorylase [Thermotoga]|uniref:carboxylating nicotinate-nucleotide diphosphorylase n=1 Tax=Thermotoga TaxID=2335 RepID=UPI000303D90E|nr:MULTISPECIES: carboxylating nicotinate-nucleotide diphosphorylase [Thermotoga]AJG40840.1 nicotinate-nucleotide pyrophosphorylase [Thermotoga sp. RQ7]KFZ22027.1 nicotinate-nucleotide pyrophosphorylase [Thermotoga neapolitana LA10]HBF11421.1 carboxylating nicotinate-nucleotide diphosphorylase [Thermotoga neapolitana]
MEKLLEILSSHVREDEGNLDIASFPLRNTTSRATVFLKTENVVASGIELAQRFLEKYHLKSIFHVKDGEFIPKKGAIGEIEGNTYSLLLIERTLLNTLSLMFSTATVTRRFARKLKHAKIAATRKTIPGFSLFQKLAVMHGGGDTHRFNLGDCVMIKDNHLKLYGSVEKAIQEVKKISSFTRKIEIEVENMEDALKAVEMGADIVMLDNMSPEMVEKVSKKIKEMNPNVVVEVSGGITEENVSDYDIETVDVISTSRLTLSEVFVDLSLEIQR